MSFDPDAFLAEEAVELSGPQRTIASDDFDPDAFIEEEFDPDAFLMAEAEGTEFDPDTFLAEETATDDDFYMGRHSDKLAEGFTPGEEVTWTQAANTLDARAEHHAREESWWMRRFYEAGMAGQFAARQAVNFLENTGNMSTEDAKMMLSKDEVMFSDVLDFYVADEDESTGEMILRGTTGFLADVILDPINAVTLGGAGTIRGSTKAIQVGARYVDDVKKLSKSEFKFLKGASEIENIVKADGTAIEAVGEGVSKNQQAVNQFVERGALGFDDFMDTIEVGDNASAQIKKVFDESLKKKGWWRELSEGERVMGIRPLSEHLYLDAGTKSVTIGGRVPFTKTVREFVVPGASLPEKPLKDVVNIMEMAGKGLAGAFDQYAPEGVKKAMGSTSGLFRSMWTKTGNWLFDQQQSLWHGERAQLNEQVDAWEAAQRRSLGSALENVPDAQKEQVFLDMVDEMEWQTPSIPEAFDKARQVSARGGKIGFSDFVSVIEKRPVDIERMHRLSQFPETLEVLAQINKQNDELLMEYKSLGLPFEELNPFGPGWVKGYAKHMLRKEYFDAMSDADKAGEYALDVLRNSGAKFDASASGRKYRGSINDANRAAMEHGVGPQRIQTKIFVDDPIALHAKRMKEMRQTINNYKLLEGARRYAVKTGAKAKAPGLGLIRFNKDHFKNMVLKENADLAKATSGASEGTEQYRQFLPNFYRSDAEDIWMPYEIYDKLLHNLNGNQLEGAKESLFKVSDFFARVFRNTALSGLGYQGLNAFSNLTTYMLSGSNMSAYAKSMMLMASKPGGKLLNYLDEAGERASLTSEELFDKMIEHGVIGEQVNPQQKGALSRIWSTFAEDGSDRFGASSELSIENIADNIAGTRSGRAAIGQRVKDIVDIGALWRVNRNLAQFNDNVNKTAVFIDRLEKGFSFEAAADAAEKYFYNYANIGGNFSKTRQVLPFTTFPMKTMELAMSEIRSGAIGKLVVPYKAQQAMQGAYVEDYNIRESLRENMPSYFEYAYDPVMGVMYPGQRQVLMELPFAMSALNFFSDPLGSVHPIIQGIGLAALSQFEDEEFESLNHDYLKEKTDNLSSLFLPGPVKDALAVMEINGVIDTGGLLSHRYEPEVLTSVLRGQINAVEVGEMKPSEMYATAGKFKNTLDFGKFVEETYGESFWYRLLFPDDIELSESGTLLNERELSMRGEFIRRHYRNMTMGLATMTKQDNNYFINRYSINRSIKKIKRSIIREKNISTGLFDAGQLKDEGFLKRMEGEIPKAKDLLMLLDREKALDELYNFSLGITEFKKEQGLPDVDIKSLIFGVGSYSNDDWALPDSLVRDLNNEQSHSDIDDDSARTKVFDLK